MRAEQIRFLVTEAVNYYFINLFTSIWPVFIEDLCSSLGFPSSSAGKEPACNAGDPSLIPGLGRSPGEGNGDRLQYSCLENSMDRGIWWARIHEVKRSRT